MTFKTVHGLGRSDYAIKAINAALDNCQSPQHVDAWLKWFDQQPGDHSSLNEAILDDIERRSQCDRCQVTTVCPDDCPQPEYYLGDLEEVAHAMVTRVESAVIELIRTVTRDPAAGLQPEVAALFEGVRAEITLPGYVEGLLPE